MHPDERHAPEGEMMRSDEVRCHGMDIDLMCVCVLRQIVG